MKIDLKKTLKKFNEIYKRTITDTNKDFKRICRITKSNASCIGELIIDSPEREKYIVKKRERYDNVCLKAEFFLECFKRAGIDCEQVNRGHYDYLAEFDSENPGIIDLVIYDDSETLHEYIELSEEESEIMSMWETIYVK